MNILKRFGGRVKELRLKKGLTVFELAALCKMKDQTIRKLESGEIDCKLDVVAVIAEVLEVEMWDLIVHD